MKKGFFVFAVLSALLSSCSKEPIISEEIPCNNAEKTYVNLFGDVCSDFFRENLTSTKSCSPDNLSTDETVELVYDKYVEKALELDYDVDLSCDIDEITDLCDDFLERITTSVPNAIKYYVSRMPITDTEKTEFIQCLMNDLEYGTLTSLEYAKIKGSQKNSSSAFIFENIHLYCAEFLSSEEQFETKANKRITKEDAVSMMVSIVAACGSGGIYVSSLGWGIVCGWWAYCITHGDDLIMDLEDAMDTNCD